MNQVFKNNPNLKQYFETSDGTKFYAEENAKAHARSLSVKTVKTVERGAEKSTSKPAKKSSPSPSGGGESSAPKKEKELTPMAAAKLRVEALDKLEAVAEIEKALEGETAKSVIKAGNERIAAIKATEALDGKEDNENVQTQ